MFNLKIYGYEEDVTFLLAYLHNFISKITNNKWGGRY